MKRTSLLLLVALFGWFVSSSVSAQGLLDRAKRAAEKAKSAATDKDDDTDKAVKDDDQQSANDVLLAVALQDNAGAYEVADKSKSFAANLGKEAGKTVGNMRSLSKEGLKQAARDRATEAAVSQLAPETQLRRSVALGENFYRWRRFQTASNQFASATKVAVKNGLTGDRAFPRAVAGWGLAAMGRGSYALADSLLRRAIHLQDSLQGDTSLAAIAARSNLAVLQREQGNYTESEQLSEKLVKASTGFTGARLAPKAILRNNHAMLLASLGRDKEAETLLREAVALLDEGDLLAVQFMSNLALVKQQQGQYQAADELYTAALKRQQKRLGSRNHPDVAGLLNGQAALHLAMGKTDDVDALLTEALRIYKSRFGEQHPAYASTLHNQGSFQLSQKNYKAAEAALTQAQTIRQQVLGANHPDLAATQDALAVLYWRTDRGQQATALFRQLNQQRLAQVQRFFPAMSETEKARFWARVQPGLERFTNYALSAGAQDPALLTDLYNLQLNTKALLLSQGSQLRNRLKSSGNRQLLAQYNAWVAATEELAAAYSRPKVELTEEGLNLDSLEQSVNTLERALSSAAAQYGGVQAQPERFDEVRKALLPGQVAVELLRVRSFDHSFTGDSRYAALVLPSGDGAVKLALGPDGKKLETATLSRYRRAIRNKQAPDSSVYNGYWGWLAPAVGEAKDVYLSLDGVYHQVSLTTLQSAPTAPFLLQQRTLHTLVSTRDLPALRKPAPKATGKAVLVGNADFAAKLNAVGERGGIAALPGTAVEVAKIQQMLTPKGVQATILLKDKATEKAVKQIKKPRLLHIATHGYFLSDVDTSSKQLVFGVQPDKALVNPMLRSGLLLSGADYTVQNLKRPEGENSEDDNGILTAYEALNLDLQGTELVVLSACETGLGDIQAGEGVYGLQRAFQLAGARALIISLWRVDDAATQQLMSRFYTYYLAGKPVKEAFQAAQLELKAKFPQPYYWGAFQLIGV